MLEQKLKWMIAWGLFTCVFALGQPAAQNQPPAEATAPDIPGVVAGGTKVQLIKAGFKSVEGPTAGPDGSLLFTDRDASQIWKVDKDGNVSSYMETTNGTSSITVDSKGRIIAAQRLPPQVGVVAPTRAVLADKFEGQPFPGAPNDVVADKKGGVYFTAGQVFYVKPDGQVIRISGDIRSPNGVALSMDEKTLYVANTTGEFVLAFDIQPDGSVRNQRDFARLEGLRQTDRGPNSGADGLTIDSTGRLYVVSNAGVEVFSPQGQHLGTIPIPITPRAQNLAFAGPDKKTLYVVGQGAVYKIQMKAQGFRGRAK